MLKAYTVGSDNQKYEYYLIEHFSEIIYFTLKFISSTIIKLHWIIHDIKMNLVFGKYLTFVMWQHGVIAWCYSKAYLLSVT